jgi:hypothetical protein
VQPSGPSRNLDLGAGLSAELSSFPEAPLLLRPGGSASAIDLEAEELPDGSWRLEDVARVDRVGFWSLRTRAGTEAAFAVGLRPDEGRLERLELAELLALSPSFTEPGSEAAPEAGGGDGELWRPLLLLVLALLVAESLWARRLTREERP